MAQTTYTSEALSALAARLAEAREFLEFVLTVQLMFAVCAFVGAGLGTWFSGIGGSIRGGRPPTLPSQAPILL
jgi:hypothetical protein